MTDAPNDDWLPIASAPPAAWLLLWREPQESDSVLQCPVVVGTLGTGRASIFDGWSVSPIAWYSHWRPVPKGPAS